MSANITQQTDTAMMTELLSRSALERAAAELWSEAVAASESAEVVRGEWFVREVVAFALSITMLKSCESLTDPSGFVILMLALIVCGLVDVGISPTIVRSLWSN